MDAASAVARRSGRWASSPSKSSSTLGTDIDTAASTSPRAPLIGAPMQWMKSSCSALSTAYPLARTRSSSSRYAAGPVMVFAVSRGNSIVASTFCNAGAGRSASRTFATAVQCNGARRPMREYMRIWCRDSYLSM